MPTTPTPVSSNQTTVFPYPPLDQTSSNLNNLVQSQKQKLSDMPTNTKKNTIINLTTQFVNDSCNHSKENNVNSFFCPSFAVKNKKLNLGTTSFSLVKSKQKSRSDSNLYFDFASHQIDSSFRYGDKPKIDTKKQAKSEMRDRNIINDTSKIIKISSISDDRPIFNES